MSDILIDHAEALVAAIDTGQDTTGPLADTRAEVARLRAGQELERVNAEAARYARKIEEANARAAELAAAAGVTKRRTRRARRATTTQEGTH